MGLSQAQSIVGTGFIPDRVETGIVSIGSMGETARVAEAKRTNGFYEAILLAVSFIFLLLGLLPSQPERLLDARVHGEEHGLTHE